MPIKYVPYVPEPVKGQAVLNFNRVLKYQGADDINATLQRGMPLYEMETKETVGDNADGNLVIRGECVSACAYLKEKGIQVDLVYIDPPFASGADYAKQVYIRRNPKVAEAIDKAEQELDVDELKAFEEKMYGDVWDKEKYLIAENMTSLQIIEKGVRDFLDTHLNTVYEGGLTAKLGIYCGTIPKCEKLVYPLVTSIVREYGLPETSVLKYHDGNKEFPAPDFTSTLASKSIEA